MQILIGDQRLPPFVFDRNDVLHQWYQDVCLHCIASYCIALHRSALYYCIYMYCALQCIALYMFKLLPIRKQLSHHLVVLLMHHMLSEILMDFIQKYDTSIVCTQVASTRNFHPSNWCHIYIRYGEKFDIWAQAVTMWVSSSWVLFQFGMPPNLILSTDLAPLDTVSYRCLEQMAAPI